MKKRTIVLVIAAIVLVVLWAFIPTDVVDRIVQESTLPPEGESDSVQSNNDQSANGKASTSKRAAARKNASPTMSDVERAKRRAFGKKTGQFGRWYRDDVGADWVHENFSKEDIPRVMEFVQTKYWMNLRFKSLELLKHLGDEGHVPALIDLYKSDDEKTYDLPRSQSDLVLSAKVPILRTIGVLGGDEALQFLQGMVTEEGALKHSAAWYNKEFPPGRFSGEYKTEALGHARRNAAIGLINTQNPEAIALIRRLYAENYDRIEEIIRAGRSKGSKQVGGTLSGQDAAEVLYFSGLAEALGRQHLIEEIGWEDYWRRPASYRNQYLGNYTIPYK